MITILRTILIPSVMVLSLAGCFLPLSTPEERENDVPISVEKTVEIDGVTVQVSGMIFSPDGILVQVGLENRSKSPVTFYPDSFGSLFVNDRIRLTPNIARTEGNVSGETPPGITLSAILHFTSDEPLDPNAIDRLTLDLGDLVIQSPRSTHKILIPLSRER